MGSLGAFPERTTPEQRKLIRPIVSFLQSDLYSRVPCDEAAMAWVSPLGHKVLLSPRMDGTGWVGEYRAPNGARQVSTSWVDVDWLDGVMP